MKKYTPAVLALIAFFLLFVTREHATNKKDVPEEEDEEPKKMESKKVETPKKSTMKKD